MFRSTPPGGQGKLTWAVKPKPHTLEHQLLEVQRTCGLLASQKMLFPGNSENRMKSVVVETSSSKLKSEYRSPSLFYRRRCNEVAERRCTHFQLSQSATIPDVKRQGSFCIDAVEQAHAGSQRLSCKARKEAVGTVTRGARK